MGDLMTAAYAQAHSHYQLLSAVINTGILKSSTAIWHCSENPARFPFAAQTMLYFSFGNWFRGFTVQARKSGAGGVSWK